MSGSRHLPSPIAIDGPAASGKSTVGAALVERFGYTFLDTGLMYRAIALKAVREQVDPADATAVARLLADAHMSVEAREATRIRLGSEDVTDLLRAPEVEANVSRYAAIPAVREAMVALQREVARNGLIALAGRDIGTVVLPGASIKVYLEASETARAERRSAQAGEWGERQDSAKARENITARDALDTTRKTSPLRPADDAIVIDTTNLSLEETVARVLELVECASI
jgi:cytidylate kinase